MLDNLKGVISILPVRLLHPSFLKGNPGIFRLFYTMEIFFSIAQEKTKKCPPRVQGPDPGIGFLTEK
jgi:hypothetical protein